MSPTSWLFWEGTISQHESQTSGLQSFRSPLLRLSLSLNVGSILCIETTEAGHPKASSSLHFDSIDFSLIPLTSLDIFSPISESSFFQTLIFFFCNTLLLVTMNPLLSFYYERKFLLVLMDCRSLWITKCGKGFNIYKQPLSVRNNSRCSVKYLI